MKGVDFQPRQAWHGSGAVQVEIIPGHRSRWAASLLPRASRAESFREFIVGLWALEQKQFPIDGTSKTFWK